MFMASDPEILTYAREQGSVVVTLDADFHAILAVSGAVDPSVIRIRLQGLNAAAVVRVICDVMGKHAAELAQGCMITVKQRKTTCHLLSKHA
jgi:predicted nuclease of predicted toxin-antitoxin system